MDILYRTQSTATGGRNGSAVTSDEGLKVILTTPKELGGAGGDGTNPEQLFASGYAACFLGAVKFVAGRRRIKLSDNASVTARVGIGMRRDFGGFALDIALEVSLPGLDPTTAQELIEEADKVCPYSRLAHNGADVAISLAA